MIITEVRIKLMDEHRSNERMAAFCSITFNNAFVVRDLKIIESSHGLFVSMPSRKLTDRCPGCGCKNHLRARFCNYCGAKLDEERAPRDARSYAKLHADMAHPVNPECRALIQTVVLYAYQEEVVRSKLPNYQCAYDADDGEFATARPDVVSAVHA